MHMPVASKTLEATFANICLYLRMVLKLSRMQPHPMLAIIEHDNPKANDHNPFGQQTTMCHPIVAFQQCKRDMETVRTKFIDTASASHNDPEASTKEIGVCNRFTGCLIRSCTTAKAAMHTIQQTLIDLNSMQLPIVCRKNKGPTP